MKAVVKKQQKVDSLVKKFEGAASIYRLNDEKIPVELDNKLRMSLKSKGVIYTAVKNTLLKKVLEKMNISGLDEALKGATSIMIGPEDDPILPAREIEAFHKENPDFLVAKSLYVEGKVRPGSDIVALSKIPDRAGMLAQLVTIILGPGSTVAGQIKSLTEKLEKEEAGATA